VLLERLEFLLEFVVPVHERVIVASHTFQVLVEVLAESLLLLQLPLGSVDGHLLIFSFSSLLLVSLQESSLVLQEEPVFLLHSLYLVV